MRRLWIATAVIWSSASFAQPPQQPAAAVEVAPVQLRDIAPTIWVPGSVISRQDSRLAAEVTGNLQSVAEVGDNIGKGQIIARVNDTLLQLQLRNDEAEIARLQSNLTYLQRQHQRSEQLAQTNNASRAELERLTMEAEMTKQQLTAAQVNRERTLYHLDKTKITAPFAGIVVERYRQPGEHLRQGDDVVRLTNTVNLEIKVQAPLSVSRYVSSANKVAIKGQTQTVVSQVRSLIPVGDERSRLLELRIEAQANQWLIGEAVKVELPNGVSQASLTVPRDALVLREREVFVFKIDADNKAQRIAVITGDGFGNLIAVSGNLQIDDQVIVRGAERLQTGQLVNVIKHHGESAGLAVSH